MRQCSVMQPWICFDFSCFSVSTSYALLKVSIRYTIYSDVCAGELSGWRDVLHHWLRGRARGRGGGRGRSRQTGQTYFQTPTQPRELPAVQGAVTLIMTSFVTQHSWCRRSWPRSGRSRPRCQAGARRADTRAVWTGTRRQGPGHSSQAPGQGQGDNVEIFHWSGRSHTNWQVWPPEPESKVWNPKFEFSD